MARLAAKPSSARAVEVARWSRRYFCPPDRDPLSTEVAVEQHVTAKIVGPHGRAHRLIEPFDRRQRKARSSGAEHNGRDQNMQAIKTARRDESGDRVGASFHENASEPALGQRGENSAGGKLTVVRGHRYEFDTGGRRCRRVGGGHDEPAGTVSRQYPRGRRQPTFWIDDDPCRV